MGVEKNGVLWRRPSIGRAVRLQECPLGELLLIVKRQNWVLTLWMVRRILVYIFCLIMTQAYHYLMKLVNWNFWILKEHNNFTFLRKFEQFRRNSLCKTPKSTNKECLSALTFFHLVILQFLIVAIFFVTDCKEPKLNLLKLHKLISSINFWN